MEERREEIYNNYKETKQEEKNGELKFTTNIEAMKQIMEEG
ncbi:hypothetical protein [Anabaena azotica]|nr:hypothetical protein [Anabaena azotica]